MARKFARAKPDMGWIVGRNAYSLLCDGNPVTIMDFWFDFADIDPEALTGKIEADKSDWFIKRAIVDVYGQAQLAGIEQEDAQRFITLGLSTIGNQNAVEVTDNDFNVFSPEWYNLQARILHTDSMVIYHPSQIPYGVGNPSNNFGIANVDMNQEPTEGGATPAGWVASAPFLGTARQHWDLQVSNAGLRNNQGLALTVATHNTGFSNWGMTWADGDRALIQVFYRVLMQKRRGA